MDKKYTELRLFLSNAVKIVIYYEGNIFDNLWDDLTQESDYFLVSNYDYSQMCIYGGNRQLLFSGNEKEEPTVIDWQKVIGFDLISPD